MATSDSYSNKALHQFGKQISYLGQNFSLFYQVSAQSVVTGHKAGVTIAVIYRKYCRLNFY